MKKSQGGIAEGEEFDNKKEIRNQSVIPWKLFYSVMTPQKWKLTNTGWRVKAPRSDRMYRIFHLLVHSHTPAQIEKCLDQLSASLTFKTTYIWHHSTTAEFNWRLPSFWHSSRNLRICGRRGEITHECHQRLVVDIFLERKEALSKMGYEQDMAFNTAF